MRPEPRTAKADRHYLVIYQDWADEVESVIMVTSMPPEVGFKALGIDPDRVLVCEEVDE